MKRIIKQFGKRRAFTIVELLTVMSIIVILMGLLVPALSKIRQFALGVKQRAQFHSIDAALELFNNEYEGYPPSGSLDLTGLPYCGSLKLCEAMMGQDLLGFHPNSRWRSDRQMNDEVDTLLYGLDPALDPELYENNLKARKGPYLPSESVYAFRMGDIYRDEDIGLYDPCNFVLCDVYSREMLTGKKTGMPILYYKAETANNLHDPEVAAEDPEDLDTLNIYNHWDNHMLVGLGKPWVVAASEDSPIKQHSLYDEGEPDMFYKITLSHKITTADRPYRADTYILLSAGHDGEYGTSDDIFNFEWKYKE